MNSQFRDIDIQLLKKYDRPGPRYTSYPTAPLFSSDFTPEDYRAEILRTNGPEATSDISLYFHFPFCDTLCYFCGCTMMVTRDRSRIDEYIAYQAIILSNVWIVLLTPLCAATLQRFVIRHEEAYLERKFGEAYLNYKRRVRRWI